MVKPEFNLLKDLEIQELDKKKKYGIPVGATDIRPKKGGLGFFSSDNPKRRYKEINGLLIYKSRNGSTYYSIRYMNPQPKQVAFPDYIDARLNSIGSGYFYGFPKFFYD